MNSTYICNICGVVNLRDAGNRNICKFCRSSDRFRAIALLFCSHILKTDAALFEITSHSFLKGCGLTDPMCYASKISEISNYTNTYYHKEPFLDITRPLSREYSENLDFLISSDVFEHIEPPIKRAFQGAHSLLKRGGILLLSVPSQKIIGTREYFPRLYQYKMVEISGDYILINKTAAGKIELYTDLEFHGGPGQTLVYRFFSTDDVIAYLKVSGFKDVIVLDPLENKYGIDIVKTTFFVAHA